MSALGQTLLFPLAARFVAGEHVDDAIAAVGKLNAQGLRASIDLLGEDVLEPQAAARTRDGYLALIGRLSEAGVRANLSLKLSALGLTFDPALAYEHLTAIVERAAATLPDPFVRIDMEGSRLLEPTLAVFRRVYEMERNTGPVLQACLRRTPVDVAEMVALGARVRLCKGAYKEPPALALHDREAIRARYLELASELLLHGHYPAIATHDGVLIEAIKAFAARHGIAAADFEFEMLYGVRAELQRQLAGEGYRVRIYVPYGTHWARYFRRRVMERRQNLLFALRSVFGK